MAIHIGRGAGLLIASSAIGMGCALGARAWAQAAPEEVAPAEAVQPEPVTPVAEPAETAASGVAAAAAESPPLDTIAVPVAAEPMPEQEPEADDRPQIAEVIVTATKREQSSRKIAGTVNVLQGEQLEAMGAREMDDYLRYVPGVTLQEGDNNSSRTISIRGIGPQPGANTTTGVLIDNVSMSDPYASYLVPDLDPFDLHDLEVLKGPQGTLFGAGALNGAIRYVLNQPKLGVVEGKAFSNYQSISQGGSAMSYGAALNVPIGETAAIRGVGVWQDLPGLYDDVNVNKNIKDADSGKKTMWRVQGLWQPIDRLSVSAFYLKQDNRRDDISVANNFDGDFVRTDTPGSSYAHQAFEVSNLDIHYDFDWFTVISETSLSKKLQDASYDGSAIVEALATRGVQTLRLHTVADTKSLSQEIRLVSPNSDSPWVWIAGAYYNRYEAQASLNTPIANTEIVATLFNFLGLDRLPGNLIDMLTPTPEGLSLEYIRHDPLRAEEKSLFGEITRKFFDKRLELTLGGRYYREDLESNTSVDGLLSLYAAALGYSGYKKLSADGFSPKAAIKFQLTPSVLFYGSAARGFQFGGLNDPAPLPTDNVYPMTYKPSTLWSYEVGTRTDWFHKTLQVDLTAFLIDWTDMQLRQGTPSGNTDYTDNVGKARSQGIEASLRWLTPVPGLMFLTNASFTRATVEQTYTTSDGFDVPAGTDLPAAPHLQTSSSLAWNVPIGAYLGGASVSYSYIGKAYSNVVHEMEIYDYGTVDASLRFGAPTWSGAPELSFTVNNLTDENAFVGGRTTHIGPITNGRIASYNRPRTFVTRLTINF
ncbi:MAG: TonB-dependent receptor domain-containing protein [Solimonas sp.]